MVSFAVGKKYEMGVEKAKKATTLGSHKSKYKEITETIYLPFLFLTIKYRLIPSHNIFRKIKLYHMATGKFIISLIVSLQPHHCSQIRRLQEAFILFI